LTLLLCVIIKGSLLTHLLVSPLYLTSIVVGGGDGGFDLAACERAFCGRYYQREPAASLFL
jgi:hypothetical protein